MATDIKAASMREAKRYLKDRVADFKKFNKLGYDWDDAPSKADQKILDELGDPNQYGLDLRKESYDYIEEEYKWQYQLSTGGPGDQFTFKADKFGGGLNEIQFAYLPWFDRIELELNLDQEAVVKQFVERFLYLEVDREGVDVS